MKTKKWLVILLVVLLALTLSVGMLACKDNEEPEGDPNHDNNNNNEPEDPVATYQTVALSARVRDGGFNTVTAAEGAELRYDGIKIATVQSNGYFPTAAIDDKVPTGVGYAKFMEKLTFHSDTYDGKVVATGNDYVGVSNTAHFYVVVGAKGINFETDLISFSAQSRVTGMWDGAPSNDYPIGGFTISTANSDGTVKETVVTVDTPGDFEIKYVSAGTLFTIATFDYNTFTGFRMNQVYVRYGGTTVKSYDGTYLYNNNYTFEITADMKDSDSAVKYDLRIGVQPVV